jgi:hypothetical protein
VAAMVSPATSIAAASSIATVPIGMCETSIKHSEHRKDEQCWFDRHVGSCSRQSIRYLQYGLICLFQWLPLAEI